MIFWVIIIFSSKCFLSIVGFSFITKMFLKQQDLFFFSNIWEEIFKEHSTFVQVFLVKCYLQDKATVKGSPFIQYIGWERLGRRFQ
jgi:hypothetical protein